MDKELALIATCLTKLHEWEMENIPMIYSSTGRLLYFRLAQQLLLNPNQQIKTLKDLYGDAQLSEKALRLRLREFEDVGLITTQAGQTDARVRCPEPTEKLQFLMESHMNEAKRLLGDCFFLIHK